MLDCQRKLNKSTVSWKPLLRVIKNAIRVSFCLMVGTVIRDIVYDSTLILISTDHPYILSFSLIMLHTDAFNRSNKRKMTKADYIKNARLEGVPTEVLDVSKKKYLHRFL